MSDSESTQTRGVPLIVIGSSAGGIEALVTFVARLPKDFPAPIVVAQHLDPARPSGLGNILDRRSAVPVVTIEEHTKLEPGHVFITPSNRHVTIHDGHIELEGDRRDRPRPSIDLLLCTAAEAYGERLIAVILTGSGSDGAAGALTVKENGGTIVVQNPQTARYPSMPLALPPTIVDHVVDIEDLASLLGDLLTGVVLKPDTTSEDGEVRAILELVGRRSNIDFRSYKPTTILRRLGRRMAITRCKTFVEYLQLLEQRPTELGEIVMAFLIKVTEFMRDAEAFDFLRTSVLPALIERARLSGKVLRFWSAGCATGEEPYSIAMVLADLLGAEMSEWNIKIFATDLDDEAIAYARRGIYPLKLLEHLPDGYVDRFFDATEGGIQIAKVLRGLVIFGQQDLSRAVPFPRIDLVLCRNVLIYFKPELQQQVLDQFSYSLHHSAGYLFLGKAETARPAKAGFELVDKKWKFYQCVQSPLAVTRAAARDATLEQRRATVKKSADERATPGPVESTFLQLQRIDEMLLRFLPFGSVMVDRGYRIVSINATARQLLGVRDLNKDHDFLHAVRGLPYAQVRAAIDNAFRDRAPVTITELELDRISNNEARYLSMSIVPMVGDGAVELAAITVADVTAQIVTRQRLEVLQREQEQLVKELSGANTRYQEINKDLQDANEELQATNEEMVITQEELQASNEELEATNEELQATNEELETNNEELQATNEELEATNDELGIRTQELQQVSRAMLLSTRTQEELEHSDKMKDEFMSLVSHELRTPMVTLTGYADMLKELFGQPLDAPRQIKATEYVGRFRKQLDHLNRMIDDLFDVARARSGGLAVEKAEIDLAVVVRDAVTEISPSLKSHSVVLDIAQGDSFVVQADGGRVAQVVSNLLQNAAAFAIGKPRIDVRLCRRDDESSAWCELTVRDHGPGIPAAALPSLFTRFFQVHLTPRPARAGLGLGLFICKQIVEAHGGTITAENTSDGAAFFVRLAAPR